MNKMLLILAATSLLLVSGCKTQRQSTATPAKATPSKIIIGEPTSESGKLNAVYTGVLPCADCDGIETTITLTPDMKFSRVMRYLGKQGNDATEIGGYNLDKSGKIVMLQVSAGTPGYYQLGENSLTQLDMQGKPIEGGLADKYILYKSGYAPEAAPVEGKKWRLIELNGRSIPPTADNGKMLYIYLKPQDKHLSAYAGCNNLMGSYTLFGKGKIRFGETASTRMNCPDMKTETELLGVLETADTYVINGSVLELSRAGMAAMARFELNVE